MTFFITHYQWSNCWPVLTAVWPTWPQFSLLLGGIGGGLSVLSETWNFGTHCMFTSTGSFPERLHKILTLIREFTCNLPAMWIYLSHTLVRCHLLILSSLLISVLQLLLSRLVHCICFLASSPVFQQCNFLESTFGLSYLALPFQLQEPLQIGANCHPLCVYLVVLADYPSWLQWNCLKVCGFNLRVCVWLCVCVCVCVCTCVCVFLYVYIWVFIIIKSGCMCVSICINWRLSGCVYDIIVINH